MKVKTRKRLRIAATAVILLIAAFFVYVSIYYHADEEALRVIREPVSGVTVEQKGNTYVFYPETEQISDPQNGLIFYPGGKVQYEAYAPLMEALAQRGILCILVHMPFNLAVFDFNAADGLQEAYPEIEQWYLSGHSLGGSMAAVYLKDHADEYRGLILLAAYSTSDLSTTDLAVMTVYGTEDGIMNRKSYQKYKKHLPGEVREMIIEGANHAGFGSYGAQRGDGQALISGKEQICQTADAIAQWIAEQTDQK